MYLTKIIDMFPFHLLPKILARTEHHKCLLILTNIEMTQHNYLSKTTIVTVCTKKRKMLLINVSNKNIIQPEYIFRVYMIKFFSYRE